MSTTLRSATAYWRLARHASSSTSRSTLRPPTRLPQPAASIRKTVIPATLTRVLGFATTSSDPASSTDPSFSKALDLLGEGTRLIEDGDVEGALGKYKESVRVKETSGGYFNLGVCEYTQSNHQGAIDAWEKSINLGPSADAYTNLASAYIMLKPPQAALAIKHLTSAIELAPDDPEIAFNLAAILESTGNLESSLKMYERAEQGGIARAAQNIRSVSAKILTAQAKPST